MMLRTLFILLLVAALCGCGSADPAEVARMATPVATPVKLQPQLLDEVEPKQEAPAEQKATDAEESVVAEEKPEEFEPPYPNRENPFLAPRRSSTHANTAGSVEQTVELLGFANVGQPKVILSINGLVVPISEGEEQSGIEVISIQPPAVVLQRDRERWQATLEN